MADFRKDIKKLIKQLEANGYQAVPHKGGYRLMRPNQTFVMVIHGTQSDSKGMRNTLTRLKSKGVSLPEGD
jgi:predicted RNA binding protein YcfA (HicA-like mRNA interferase family)